MLAIDLLSIAMFQLHQLRVQIRAWDSKIIEDSQLSEAGTETIFENICYFQFQEQLFPDSSRRLYVFNKQILIFEKGILVCRTDNNFPVGLFLFAERYRFSRKVCLFVDWMPIFQEGMSVLQTDANFPGGLFLPSFCLQRTDSDILGAFFWLPRRYRCSKSPFQVTEQISNFRISSYIDKQFLGSYTPYIKQLHDFYNFYTFNS